MLDPLLSIIIDYYRAIDPNLSQSLPRKLAVRPRATGFTGLTSIEVYFNQVPMEASLDGVLQQCDPT